VNANLSDAMSLALAVAGGFGSDLLFVAVFRRELRATESGRWTRILFVAITSIGVATVLTAGLIALSSTLSPVDRWGWRRLLVMIASSNVAAFAVSLSMAFIAAALVVHRLVWPFLGRPVYALQRYRIFEHRIVLGSAGVALLAAAFPGWTALLQAIVGPFLK
jgi:hypothetical protein